MFVVQKIESKLTVFFDSPFWVAVYEREEGGRLSACKITFGAEPRDCEVYEFLLQNWGALRFSPPVKAQGRAAAPMNPKRMQRAVRRELQASGTGTKSQQALALQRDEDKNRRRADSRRRREDEKEHQFELRQQKRKEKHRGR